MDFGAESNIAHFELSKPSMRRLSSVESRGDCFGAERLLFLPFGVQAPQSWRWMPWFATWPQGYSTTSDKTFGESLMRNWWSLSRIKRSQSANHEKWCVNLLLENGSYLILLVKAMACLSIVEINKYLWGDGCCLVWGGKRWESKGRMKKWNFLIDMVSFSYSMWYWANHNIQGGNE